MFHVDDDEVKISQGTQFGVNRIAPDHPSANEVFA